MRGIGVARSEPAEYRESGGQQGDGNCHPHASRHGLTEATTNR